MRTSDSIKELAGAMNKAQSHMTAAKKDSANPFFKSKYADLGSVILALKEAFAENGLSYMQAPIMQDNAVGVTTRVMHESGEWIEETLMLPLAKMDAQAAGSAITYARRYALQSMAGIPAADDDAEFAMGRSDEKPAKAKPAEKITADQAKRIREGLFMASISEEDFCVKVRLDKVEDLEASRFDGALKFIQQKAQEGETNAA